LISRGQIYFVNLSPTQGRVSRPETRRLRPEPSGTQRSDDAAVLELLDNFSLDGVNRRLIQKRDHFVCAALSEQNRQYSRGIQQVRHLFGLCFGAPFGQQFVDDALLCSVWPEFFLNLP